MFLIQSQSKLLLRKASCLVFLIVLLCLLRFEKECENSPRSRTALPLHKLRPELAADAQQTAWSKMQAKVNSSQYTFIIPHRVIQLTSHSGSPRQGCASHKSTNKQIPSKASEEPSDTVIHSYFCFFFIHRRALLSASQRKWSSNRANVPRTWWAKLFGPRI